MKIPTNRVSSVIKYIREEIKPYYDKEEIENFIYYLFEAFLGFSRIDLVMKNENTMNESVLLKFSGAVKELKKHKPIQYIIGYTEFYGLKIKVNAQVLIPRPETEELVNLIIKDVKEEYKNQALSILDIGTGSACIAITLKHNISQANISAIDISEDALKVAKENALSNKVEIKFMQQDILQFKTASSNLQILKSSNSQYDIIVSNPPYILNSEKQFMDKNVMDYEPHLALFVDDTDSILFYRAIANFAGTHLKESGRIYFEINEDLADTIIEMLKEKGFKNILLKKDLSGKNRILRCSYN